MLRIFFIAAALSVSFIATADAPDSAPLGWGYEFGFTNANNGTGLRFLVETQSLFESQHESEARKDSYSLTFGAESFSVSGETVDMASLGIRIRRLVDGYKNNSYLDVNALYSYSDAEKLFPEENIWGSRVVFGFDLPYAQYERSSKPGEFLYGYFFVEGGWLIGFPKASEVNGRPDLLNGIITTVGFKARWY